MGCALCAGNKHVCCVLDVCCVLEATMDKSLQHTLIREQQKRM
jgi:hypothetical protein